MLVQHDREKLIQAINFFARNTRKCGKTKLFKLLYFLDFEHFKRTGRSVTGLEYFAWPMGPVPVALHEEIDRPRADMAEALEFQDREIRGGEHRMLAVRPRVPFDDAHFSKRELDLMHRLVAEYRNADADTMIEATHLENKPWDRIYNKLGHRQSQIPYQLAIRPDEVDDVMRVAHDRADLREKLK